MNVVSIIVAVTRNLAIGRGGGMPFHIPADLRHFKKVTMGKPIIMGRHTWESLPVGALPGRRNIVISRRENYHPEGAEVATSLEEALAMTADVPETMIIGGGEVYRQAMPLADRMYITEIDADVPDADTFFPEWDNDVWAEDPDSIAEETDARSGLKLRFVCLSRK